MYARVKIWLKAVYISMWYNVMGSKCDLIQCVVNRDFWICLCYVCSWYMNMSRWIFRQLALDFVGSRQTGIACCNFGMMPEVCVLTGFRTLGWDITEACGCKGSALFTTTGIYLWTLLAFLWICCNLLSTSFFLIILEKLLILLKYFVIEMYWLSHWP